MTDTTPAGVSPAPAAPVTEQTWADAFSSAPVKEEPKAAPEPTEDKQAQPEPTEAKEPEKATEATADDAPEISSLDDLIKWVEAKPEDIYQLGVKVKVDGKEEVKSLSDIIKNYQLDAHVTQKSQEVSALREQAKQVQEQVQQQAAQRIQQLEAIAQYGQQVLNQEFQAVDWTRLQVEDPVGYMTQRQAFADRQAQLGAYVQQVQQQSQQQQAQVQQNQQAQIAETLKQAQAQRPEWTNQETMQKDFTAIRNAFLEHGFTQNDLPNLLMHPTYLLAADAATKYWNLQKSNPEVQKRVTAAPKFVKPGAGRTTQPKTKASAALSRLQANPKDKDAQAAAFEALTE